jgi:hypothetical protein
MLAQGGTTRWPSNRAAGFTVFKISSAGTLAALDSIDSSRGGMMRRENHATKKRDAVISERMERRLAAYVTAAGAAGVGLLAFAQPAEAQIDYTPASVKLECGPHVQGTYFCPGTDAV